jgi:hypothetical protein
VLLEKEKLSLEGSVKEKLIQLVLAFDSSFYKGKKTLHNDQLCCFSCLFLDWIELVLCECGFLMLGWFECMNLYWLYIYWGNKCLGLSLIRLICKKKRKKKKKRKEDGGGYRVVSTLNLLLISYYVMSIYDLIMLISEILYIDA